MNNLHPAAFLRRYGLYLLAGVLLGVKAYIFYKETQLGYFEGILALATVGILAAFCGLLRFISPKLAKGAFGILYCIGSFFMAADCIYYAYVAKLPSIAQLGMTGQLTDISEMLEQLYNFRNLGMLMDLPLWFLLFVNRKHKRSKPSQRELAFVPHEPWMLLSCGVLAALVLICAGLFGTFRPEYMINELWCYHTADIVKTIENTYNDTAVDKSLYTLQDDSDSPYFGIAAGRNVFVLQVEALQNFVIGAFYNGQEITPNLNSLLEKDTIYFPRYYYQIGGGNTADAEFTVNNSLYAPESQAAYVQYTDNDYYGLPWLLKDNGYSGAHVFHNYKGDFWNRRAAYPYQGFDSYTALEDLEEREPFAMGISDGQLFQQSMAYLTQWEQPFYAFYITVSSHHPYGIPLEYREITLLPEDEATLFGLYLQAIHYVDQAIGAWLEALKEENLYDNSIFVIYGDHYALSNSDPKITAPMNALLGRNYTIFDMFNVPLLLHIPGAGVTETLSVAGGHIDVLPTLLCLLGIEKVQTVMFGQNLLTAESGFVPQQTHLSIGSFIADDVFFLKPHNNILENYSVYASKTMEMLSPEPFYNRSAAAAKRIEDCAALMAQNNLFLPG